MRTPFGIAALCALALVAGCSEEQEQEIEELPAAPAPELTAPADPLDTLADSLQGDSIGAVP